MRLFACIAHSFACSALLTPLAALIHSLTCSLRSIKKQLKRKRHTGDVHYFVCVHNDMCMCQRVQKQGFFGISKAGFRMDQQTNRQTDHLTDQWMVRPADVQNYQSDWRTDRQVDRLSYEVTNMQLKLLILHEIYLYTAFSAKSSNAPCRRLPIP